MTELQEKLLDMLKWFHNFCEKEGLTYFAAGGTALGAVRHKGFIPWDDDIDVGMPRPDYEKFLKLAKKINGQSDYFVEFSQGQKEYVYSFAKIYDTRTTLIEDIRYKAKRGIYIDVFPIDGVGNSEEECNKNFKLVHQKINILRMLVVGLKKKRSLKKTFLILAARCIPSFVLSHTKLIAQIRELAMKCEYDKCDYVVNYGGAWGKKEIIKRQWIGKPQISRFENIDIYIPNDYDAYLTALYGDYMTLPPVSKRCSQHNYLYINLEQSYME